MMDTLVIPGDLSVHITPSLDRFIKDSYSEDSL